MSVNITIVYRLAGEDADRVVNLTEAEYFDLEAGETAEVDSTTRHAHAFQYVAPDKANDIRTWTTITDDQHDLRTCINERRTAFGMTIECFDYRRGEEVRWEMIMEVRDPTDPTNLHIVRLAKDGSAMKVIRHVYVACNGTPSESVRELDWE